MLGCAASAKADSGLNRHLPVRSLGVDGQGRHSLRGAASAQQPYIHRFTESSTACCFRILALLHNQTLMSPGSLVSFPQGHPLLSAITNDTVLDFDGIPDKAIFDLQYVRNPNENILRESPPSIDNSS